jgi:hypothetical protein
MRYPQLRAQIVVHPSSLRWNTCLAYNPPHRPAFLGKGWHLLPPDQRAPAMRKGTNENKLSDAITEAYFEISALAEEMQEAFNNTPEQFKENSGRSREEAAHWLEAVLEPQLPAELAGDSHWVKWPEMVAGKDRRIFRPARRNNIVNCLRSCLAYISKFPETDELKSAKQSLEITIHNLESIFFPGMTGR